MTPQLIDRPFLGQEWFSPAIAVPLQRHLYLSTLR